MFVLQLCKRIDLALCTLLRLSCRSLSIFELRRNSFEIPMAHQSSAGFKQAVRKISQSFRRKTSGGLPNKGQPAEGQPSTSGRSEDFFLNCKTGQASPSYGRCHLRYTQASYQARDPVRDATVLVVRLPSFPTTYSRPVDVPSVITIQANFRYWARSFSRPTKAT